MTESFHTNIHTFVSSVLCRSEDDASRWREVTASERARLETADAEWKRPPEELIGRWIDAGAQCYKMAGSKETYGVRPSAYNEETGFFELNGLTDITAAQARLILDLTYKDALHAPARASGGNVSPRYYKIPGLRTAFPTWLNYQGGQGIYANSMFQQCQDLEVYLSAKMTDQGAFDRAFYNCAKLRRVEFPVGVHRTWLSTFYNCAALETVRISGISKDISFAQSPLLSPESVTYMVTNSNTIDGPFTMTLHPDAFARVPEETLELAASKEISIVSA